LSLPGAKWRFRIGYQRRKTFQKIYKVEKKRKRKPGKSAGFN